MTILSHGKNSDCPDVQAGKEKRCPSHNLDEMIMGVEVMKVLPHDRIRVKFLAIMGGTGPELTMPRTLATNLRDLLNEALS